MQRPTVRKELRRMQYFRLSLAIADERSQEKSPRRAHRWNDASLAAVGEVQQVPVIRCRVVPKACMSRRHHPDLGTADASHLLLNNV
jgi:hypothetical protein